MVMSSALSCTNAQNIFNAHLKKKIKIFLFFFNWDSLHARLNSHYKAWSYKKKKHKKIKAYRKSV